MQSKLSSDGLLLTGADWIEMDNYPFPDWIRKILRASHEWNHEPLSEVTLRFILEREFIWSDKVFMDNLFIQLELSYRFVVVNEDQGLKWYQFCVFREDGEKVCPSIR